MQHPVNIYGDLDALKKLNSKLGMKNENIIENINGNINENPDGDVIK